MEKLSTEVLSIILTHLLANPTQERPSAYATVARSWQYVVEAFSFAKIIIESNELDSLDRIFSGPGLHRRCLLRELKYAIGLPTHGDSREDHTTNERAFGSAVQSLFHLLKPWDKDHDGSHDEQYGRIAWSYSNLELHLWLSYSVDTQNKSGAARRYHTLLPEFNIPQVHCITSLVVGPILSLTAAYHPTTLCQIATLLPSLRSLHLNYRDPAVKRHTMRKGHRAALASGLRALASNLPELETLWIRRDNGKDPSNHSFACSDLQNDGVDPLCDAISHLAEICHLKELHLENIMISPDLFRHKPSGISLPDADQEFPTFPDLRRLAITSGILAPSGKWYYTGDPAPVQSFDDEYIPDDDEHDDAQSDVNSGDGSGDENNSARDRFVNGECPYHVWRTRPDPDTFDPLIQDLTEAMLKRMPRLELAQLRFGSGLHGSVGITIQWFEAGYPLLGLPSLEQSRVEDVTVRRCKASVGRGSEWEVPAGVMAMWREWAGASCVVETGVWL